MKNFLIYDLAILASIGFLMWIAGKLGSVPSD